MYYTPSRVSLSSRGSGLTATVTMTDDIYPATQEVATKNITIPGEREEGLLARRVSSAKDMHVRNRETFLDAGSNAITVPGKKFRELNQ